MISFATNNASARNKVPTTYIELELIFQSLQLKGRSPWILKDFQLLHNWLTAYLAIDTKDFSISGAKLKNSFDSKIGSMFSRTRNMRLSIKILDFNSAIFPFTCQIFFSFVMCENNVLCGQLVQNKVLKHFVSMHNQLAFQFRTQLLRKASNEPK